MTLRRLDPDEDAVDAALAVAEVGFGAPGTAPGPEGRAERDAVTLAAGFSEHMRERLRTGQSVIVVAETPAGPAATGTLRPVGDVAEIVGVATLPAVRRQGLGGAVTGALVEIALESGIDDRVPVRRQRRDRPRLRAARLPARRHRVLPAVSERPALAGVLGALTIAFTAILVAKASVAAGRGRAVALRVRAAGARRAGVVAEQRRFGPRRLARAAAGGGRRRRVRGEHDHLALRDPRRRRRPQHRARQHPGRRRAVPRLGDSARARPAQHSRGAPAGLRRRPVRVRRAGGRRLRREPAARRGVRDRRRAPLRVASC